MKVLIIEDEVIARARLIDMLKQADATIEVAGVAGSVKDAVGWLLSNPSPDLAFIDIQLSDDHSFQIFRQVDIKFPVIFTTAYDKYLLESFEYNSIDYLLKPLSEEKLRRALTKFANLKNHFAKDVSQFINEKLKEGNERIVVKKGAGFHTLNYTDIAYFFTAHRIVFACDFAGKKYIVDKNITQIHETVDHGTFFRLNRKFIVHINAIDRFRPDNGKIQVFLSPPVDEDVHVSKETAPEFRKWVGKV